jgi:hypothetical protein
MAAAPCPAGGGQCSALATGVVAAKGEIVMRRIGLIVALGALLGMFGGVVTASPALADRGPKWAIVPTPDPFILAGGTNPEKSFCAFGVKVTVLVNREYYKELKTDDGSVVISLVTGSVTASFTNVETGKTITENISGPYEFTTVDGQVVGIAFKGLTFLAVEQGRAQQFGLPAVSVIAGGLTVSVAGPIFTSASLQGHVLVDICAALS